jgi:hypothetical protein
MVCVYDLLGLTRPKGTETFLCDIHFSLFIEAVWREERSEEYYQSLRISDCYIYGLSTRNICIEGLWRQQRFTTTITWIDYFKSLQEVIPALYKQHNPADQIVFLYLFMPILRDELKSFVSTHNAHRIRAKPNPLNHVAGVPDGLYRTGQQHGFIPNNEVLSALDSALPEYGKYNRR